MVPIIASGDSARILHYVENNRECKDSDLILMDFGGIRKTTMPILPVPFLLTANSTCLRKRFTMPVFTSTSLCAASILKPGISIVDYMKRLEMKPPLFSKKIGLLKNQTSK